jgi:two-component system CheB/CheR fusion protein
MKNRKKARVEQKHRRPAKRNISAQEPDAASKGFPIVGVGASAGGLEAFTQLLSNLPTGTGMGFVLIQHLDPGHASALPQILTRATPMPVREITNNLRVEPNHVYVIPPNKSLSIERGVLKLWQRQPRMLTRSIDSFFKSLAQDQNERAVGVILSGTAYDGALGLEAIKAEGGIAFAQDDSAKYDSMPRNAIAAGCVDFVLSPKDIARELARIAKHPYTTSYLFETETPEEATTHEEDKTALRSGGRGSPRTGAGLARRQAETASGKGASNGFKTILLQLRSHSGVDFSLYRPSTIRRRISRRVILNKLDSLDDYTHFLRGNAKELDALYSDVLISVTSFFRNPDAYEFLKREIFPRFLQQRVDDPYRMWVLGCSTGQEAYSLAMAFLECAESAPRPRKLQVFATDVNETLLDKARYGLYTRNVTVDVSPERLGRFFAKRKAAIASASSCAKRSSLPART